MVHIFWQRVTPDGSLLPDAPYNHSPSKMRIKKDVESVLGISGEIERLLNKRNFEIKSGQ